jgi:hypothetical protein
VSENTSFFMFLSSYGVSSPAPVVDLLCPRETAA